MGKINALDSVVGGGTGSVSLIEADGVDNCPGLAVVHTPLSVEINKITGTVTITEAATSPAAILTYSAPTVTASAPVFASGDVGRIIWLPGTSTRALITAFTDSTHVTVTMLGGASPAASSGNWRLGGHPVDLIFACEETLTEGIPEEDEDPYDSDETEYRPTITVVNGTSQQIQYLHFQLGYLSGGSWVASPTADRVDFAYTQSGSKHCAAVSSSSGLTHTAPTTNEELWSSSGSPAGAPALQPGESKTFSFSIDVSNGYANVDSTGTDYLPPAARDGTDFFLTLRVEAQTSEAAVVTGTAGIPATCGHPIAHQPCAMVEV